MHLASLKISDARKNFSKILERTNSGEEIIIMPATQSVLETDKPTAKRSFSLLRHTRFPEGFFADHNADHAARYAGGWGDDACIW